MTRGRPCTLFLMEKNHSSELCYEFADCCGGASCDVLFRVIAEFALSGTKIPFRCSDDLNCSFISFNTFFFLTRQFASSMEFPSD